MKILASHPFLENENCAIFHTQSGNLVWTLFQNLTVLFSIKTQENCFFIQIFNGREKKWFVHFQRISD